MNNAVILYGRWEVPRSTGLFGLTWRTTIFAGGLIIACILTQLILQVIAVTATVLAMGLVLLVPLVWRRRGRTGWELIILRWQFWRAARRGETLWRGGVFGRVPGSARMPGIQGDTRLYEYELRSGQRFGLIHARAKDHYTVVLACQPQGQERVDQWQINQWVAGWDDFLAYLGTTQGVVGAMVVNETVPDAGQRISTEVRSMVVPHAPAYARQVMAETAMYRASATVRNECRVSITFARQREADSGDVADQGAAIGRLLSALVSRAAGAGLDAAPLTASDLCVVGARAWRPELAAELESAVTTGDHEDLRWDNIGCAGAKGDWDHYVHNGFRSVTWEMGAAPAGTVRHDSLLPLLAPRTDLPRKRVAIIYRIHNIGEAVTMVDNDFRDALSAEQTKTGIGSAAASLRVDNTKAAREEQARGAGLTRFGVLITLTAPRDADLPQLTAELQGVGSAARLGIQRVYGAQDASFAGSLGLGILLPEYTAINKRMSA